MRAAQFSEFGGLEALRLEEVADPVPGPGEILIKVTAVGLNFFDTLMLRNKYQVTPPLPFSPGAEVAGTVEQLGEGVNEFSVGQRLVAFIGGNGCREKVVTKAKNALLIPDGVSDEVAAGIPITYGTALHAFKDRAALKPKETVAVLGAAGGAGLAAIEVAKLMGARVIALASSGDKLAFAREHGAVAGINYETEEVKSRLKASTWCSIRSAGDLPSRRCGQWPGKGVISCSDSPRAKSRACRSICCCSRAARFWACSGRRSSSAIPRSIAPICNCSSNGAKRGGSRRTFTRASRWSRPQRRFR